VKDLKCLLALKSALVLIFLHLTIGISYPNDFSYNGEWKGTTDQGYEMSFTVRTNKVTRFTIKYESPGGSKITYTKKGEYPIVGNRFIILLIYTGPGAYTWKVEGTFTDKTSSNGTYYDSRYAASGTWEAIGGPHCSISPAYFDVTGEVLSVISSFDSKGLGPKGLAFDGSHLWHTDDHEDKIYKLDTSGNTISSFDSPDGFPTGLAYDGSHLWHAAGLKNIIYKLDTFGNIISSFNGPGNWPRALTFDGTYLWLADHVIYKLDTTGTVISSFDAPDFQAGGLAFDGKYLWFAGVINDTIYKLDTSGKVISSFDAPGTWPQGLAFDGTYLWHADKYDSKIYQLELPAIIKVGSSITRAFTITNSGNEDLVIGPFSITGDNASHFSIQNDSCSDHTIAPSATCNFDLIFSPRSAGVKYANLQIPSNDPHTPVLDVPLSGTGVGGSPVSVLNALLLE